MTRVRRHAPRPATRLLLALSIIGGCSGHDDVLLQQAVDTCCAPLPSTASVVAGDFELAERALRDSHFVERDGRAEAPDECYYAASTLLVIAGLIAVDEGRADLASSLRLEGSAADLGVSVVLGATDVRELGSRLQSACSRRDQDAVDAVRLEAPTVRDAVARHYGDATALCASRGAIESSR